MYLRARWSVASRSIRHSFSRCLSTVPGNGLAKAIGDATDDVVYTPVTPCRLVETRGTFAAVYQGNGPSHTAFPFNANEIRTYTIQGGNSVCTSQLPSGLGPVAVQLQVFGIPTTAASGDIEILPQGSTFGKTATEVFIGSIAFNTVSTTTEVNATNNEISVQVRGGKANLAMDVVGYFKKPGNYGANDVYIGWLQHYRWRRRQSSYGRRLHCWRRWRRTQRQGMLRLYQEEWVASRQPRSVLWSADTKMWRPGSIACH